MSTSLAILSQAFLSNELQSESTHLHADRKVWTTDLMMHIKSIDTVIASPDGAHVLYITISNVIDETKSEQVKSLYISSVCDNKVVYTQQFNDAISSAQWSPNSEKIAYIMEDAHKSKQVWLLDWKLNCSTQLTFINSNVSSFKWAPSADKIAFTALEPLSEVEQRNKQGKNDAYIVSQNSKNNHLYVLDLVHNELEPRIITSGATSQTSFTSFLGGGGYDWSKDSTQLTCAVAETPQIDAWLTCYLKTYHLDTGESLDLVNEGKGEFSPVYSPDGKSLAYIAATTHPKWPHDYTVWVIDLETGTKHQLADTADKWPTKLIGWSADSKNIYATESRRTYNAITVIPVDGSATYDFTSAHRLYLNAQLNASGTYLTYASESLYTPQEAFITSVKQFNPSQLTHFNNQFNKYPLPQTDIIEWKSQDGLPIEGMLTYPLNDSFTDPVPLILVIHGGPLSASREFYMGNADIESAIAILAQKGCAILRCNFRGSTGYGKNFRHLNVGDWGGMDYADIMTGVDHVIELGIADPTKMAVMGWSYGGYMTAWVLARSERFKAAVAGAGVYNLISTYATSDIPEFFNQYAEVKDFPDWQALVKHSPLFHINKKTLTATLIQHGDLDIRVPISQSYELHSLLKGLKSPVEMVVYPRTLHAPSEPKLKLDLINRRIDFVSKQLELSN